MAFKFTSSQHLTIVQSEHKLKILADKVSASLDQFNDSVSEAHELLLEKVNAYNEEASEVGDFLLRVHTELDADFREMSDNWQEGERAEVTRVWLDEVEAVAGSCEPYNTPEAPFLLLSEVIDTASIELLNDLPIEPNY
jgi:predicted trehalose synthase